MTVLLLQCVLALATPAIEDVGDAHYLGESGRENVAADWYRARIDGSTDEAQSLLAYLRLLSRLPRQRTATIGPLVRAWALDHADDPRASTAVATAYAVGAMNPSVWSTDPRSEPGPWCVEAVAALSVLPQDAPARYDALQVRMSIADPCGLDAEAEQAAAKELALTGEAGPYVRAWFGATDGVDQDDVDAIRAALDERPWKLSNLARYFKDDLEGDGLQAARALLIERAEALAASNQPSRVNAAASLFRSAKQDDQAIAAYERLRALDPDNPSVAWRIEQLRSPSASGPAADAEPEATTVLDPAKRLALLEAEKPPKGQREQTRYWSARVEAARASGDDDALMVALDALWRVSPSAEPNLAFAEHAAATGQRLKDARRAMAVALEVFANAPVPIIDTDGSAWRADYARALAVQATLDVALGHPRDAEKHLEHALALAPGHTERMIRLGSLYEARGEAWWSVPLLTAGLAQSSDLARHPEAVSALDRALTAQKIWAPGGVEAWVAARRQADAATPEAAVASALDASRFDDFEVIIDGASQRLLDIEGPVVVDLWATWCGPCMESLPHLDGLTRAYEGRVTFVAVSVDEQQAVADRYIAKRGGAAFVQAFAGAEGMDRLGVHGIPAMFVFDAEHRLVEKLTGWGPGNTDLDDAIAAMLGE